MLDAQLALRAPDSTVYRWLGYGQQARDLLERARAFVFAAEEDFGIAMVEVQACGAPVIAYGKGGAAEIVRDLDEPAPTGVLFHQQTPEALVAAIQHFEAHHLRVTASACRDNAERFASPIQQATVRPAQHEWRQRRLKGRTGQQRDQTRQTALGQRGAGQTA
nr:glycosyltransferase [uncultured Caulobacter sp.]